MPDEQQSAAPAAGDDAVIDAAADDAAPGRKAAKKTDAEKKTDKDKPEAERSGGPLFSPYGIASTVLGLLSVAAIVVGLITWSMHRSDVDEREYRSRVLQTAASWTSVLINLNAENVEKGMQRLHDKTVGQLNGEFEVALQPYREVVQRIQSRSTGRIEAVALETVRYDPDGNSASEEAEQGSGSGPGRTDPVTVVATSIAENVGGQPQTVHWALELEVTEVDGRLLISRLRSIR